MAEPHALATAAAMRAALAALEPLRLEIEDQSARHAGHAGARGGGHFGLLLVSARFEGVPRLGRHRLVYDSVAHLLRRDIHALTMTLLTPDEASAAGTLPSDSHLDESNPQ